MIKGMSRLGAVQEAYGDFFEWAEKEGSSKQRASPCFWSRDYDVLVLFILRTTLIEDCRGIFRMMPQIIL